MRRINSKPPTPNLLPTVLQLILNLYSNKSRLQKLKETMDSIKIISWVLLLLRMKLSLRANISAIACLRTTRISTQQ